jgi:hypothetical protein
VTLSHHPVFLQLIGMLVATSLGLLLQISFTLSAPLKALIESTNVLYTQFRGSVHAAEPLSMGYEMRAFLNSQSSYLSEVGSEQSLTAKTQWINDQYQVRACKTTPLHYASVPNWYVTTPMAGADYCIPTKPLVSSSSRIMNAGHCESKVVRHFMKGRGQRSAGFHSIAVVLQFQFHHEPYLYTRRLTQACHADIVLCCTCSGCKASASQVQGKGNGSSCPCLPLPISSLSWWISSMGS